MINMSALEAYIAKNLPKAKKWLKQPAPGNVLTKGGALGAGALGAGGLAYALSDDEQQPQLPQSYEDTADEDYQVILRKLSRMQGYE